MQRQARGSRASTARRSGHAPLLLEILELLGNVHQFSQDPIACNVVYTATEFRVSRRVLFHLLVDWSRRGIDLMHVVLVGQLLQGVQALFEEVRFVIQHEVRHHLKQGGFGNVVFILNKLSLNEL